VTRDCPENFTKCAGESPSVWCIFDTQVCDGNNNCGNNWDEDPTMCGKKNHFGALSDLSKSGG